MICRFESVNFNGNIISSCDRPAVSVFVFREDWAPPDVTIAGPHVRAYCDLHERVIIDCFIKVSIQDYPVLEVMLA